MKDENLTRHVQVTVIRCVLQQPVEGESKSTPVLQDSSGIPGNAVHVNWVLPQNYLLIGERRRISCVLMLHICGKH